MVLYVDLQESGLVCRAESQIGMLVEQGICGALKGKTMSRKKQHREITLPLSEYILLHSIHPIQFNQVCVCEHDGFGLNSVSCLLSFFRVQACLWLL